jgi:hypothetical protein
MNNELSYINLSINNDSVKKLNNLSLKTLSHLTRLKNQSTPAQILQI